MRRPDSEALENFIGEEVVDNQGNPIGTLACFWEHEENVPVLLGIEVGEHSNEIHLLPVEGAKLDEAKSYIAVDFAKEKVRKAPVLDCGSEPDAKLERKVFQYYGATLDEESDGGMVNPLRRKAHASD